MLLKGIQMISRFDRSTRTCRTYAIAVNKAMTQTLGSNKVSMNLEDVVSGSAHARSILRHTVPVSSVCSQHQLGSL